jgi:hypothetical protein
VLSGGDEMACSKGRGSGSGTMCGVGGGDRTACGAG